MDELQALILKLRRGSGPCTLSGDEREFLATLLGSQSRMTVESIDERLLANPGRLDLND